MLSLLRTRRPAPFFHLNPPDDTAWAQTLPGTERLLHLVYKRDGGVRSAAAYTPGHKLVVATDELTPLLQDFAQLWHRLAVQRLNEILQTS